MAIRDGVDVGILGILRGGPLQSPSRHETLAKMLLGAAIGALAFDANLTDSEIAIAVQGAIDNQELFLMTPTRALALDHDHLLLAGKLLRLAVHELYPSRSLPTRGDIVDLCRSLLAQCRVVVSDTRVHESVAGLVQAIRSAS